MEKQFLAFTFGILTTASIFIFTAFVGKNKPIELSNNSKSIFMGGKFNSFQNTLNLIQGNKDHNIIMGDQYIKSETFDIDLVKELISKNDVEGLRIYYGYDTKSNQKQLILTVANKDGLDIEKNGLVLNGEPCPKWCPDNKSGVKNIFGKVMN